METYGRSQDRFRVMKVVYIILKVNTDTKEHMLVEVHEDKERSYNAAGMYQMFLLDTPEEEYIVVEEEVL